MKISPSQLLQIRNDLIEIVENPLHGLGATVTDHGFDLTKNTAEFVMELPDGNRYNVEMMILS